MTPIEQRALRAMADPRAVIARSRDGACFAVFAQGDQRRRTAMELQRDHVERWLQQGLIQRVGRSLYRLSLQGQAAVAQLTQRQSAAVSAGLPPRLRECVSPSTPGRSRVAL